MEHSCDGCIHLVYTEGYIENGTHHGSTPMCLLEDCEKEVDNE
jgi:hypothetical protein